MIRREGVKAIQRLGILFHLPIFGGWRQYIVLAAEHHGKWHIGWSTPDQTAVSRLALNADEPVRMLLGPGSVSFFAITAEGFQIPLAMIGQGRIGDNGPHSKVTLL
jgi:hypothetical protein